MNKVNMIKQLKFSNELITIFNSFSTYLDSYFKIDENINNNKELYEYYCNFKEKIVSLAKYYGVVKK